MNEQAKQIANWVATGNVGTSSKTMLGVTSGAVTGQHPGTHPLDPSDFKRCVGLLTAVPSLRENLHLMKDVSPEWCALIENWDYLEKTLEIQLEMNPKQAPFLYDLMTFLMRKKPVAA